MATFSFDIVSEYDKAEMNNVFAQVQKEITGRYDFKNTPAEIDWMTDKVGFKLTGANEWQIESIIDIIRKKLSARELSSKVLDLSKAIVTSNLKATQEVTFVAGLDQDKAKKITKMLRDALPKVKTQIQGESVRATAGSKDDLQSAMQLIRAADFDFPVAFNNYR
ncbi:YajQ family cyclic di-GMP-binding protein [Candidatus Saccharibacteria bacterium]|nr:YajQ family cyclic di-GMP-binding protein [Candidatus Saccharibacteria bacterium]